MNVKWALSCQGKTLVEQSLRHEFGGSDLDARSMVAHRNEIMCALTKSYEILNNNKMMNIVTFEIEFYYFSDVAVVVSPDCLESRWIYTDYVTAGCLKRNYINGWVFRKFCTHYRWRGLYLAI